MLIATVIQVQEGGGVEQFPYMNYPSFENFAIRSDLSRSSIHSVLTGVWYLLKQNESKTVQSELKKIAGLILDANAERKDKLRKMQFIRAEDQMRELARRGSDTGTSAKFTRESGSPIAKLPSGFGGSQESFHLDGLPRTNSYNGVITPPRGANFNQSSNRSGEKNYNNNASTPHGISNMNSGLNFANNHSVNQVNSNSQNHKFGYSRNRTRPFTKKKFIPVWGPAVCDLDRAMFLTNIKDNLLQRRSSETIVGESLAMNAQDPQTSMKNRDSSTHSISNSTSVTTTYGALLAKVGGRHNVKSNIACASAGGLNLGVPPNSDADSQFQSLNLDKMIMGANQTQSGLSGPGLKLENPTHESQSSYSAIPPGPQNIPKPSSISQPAALEDSGSAILSYGRPRAYTGTSLVGAVDQTHSGGRFRSETGGSALELNFGSNESLIDMQLNSLSLTYNGGTYGSGTYGGGGSLFSGGTGNLGALSYQNQMGLGSYTNIVASSRSSLRNPSDYGSENAALMNEVLQSSDSASQFYNLNVNATTNCNNSRSGNLNITEAFGVHSLHTWGGGQP